MTNELTSDEEISLDKQEIIDLFKKMYDRYSQEFSDGNEESTYKNFYSDILPGFAEFIVNSEVIPGASIVTNLTNFISVKHGCWLNSLNFISKYKQYYENRGYEINLGYGFIIHRNDIERIESELSSEDKYPVSIRIVPHGFIVLKEKETDKVFIFDPTLGFNVNYYYFYKIVPEEIWKSFKYYYNNQNDWEVKDFAEWTTSKIREELETHSFLGNSDSQPEEEPAENEYDDNEDHNEEESDQSDDQDLDLEINDNEDANTETSDLEDTSEVMDNNMNTTNDADNFNNIELNNTANNSNEDVHESLNEADESNNGRFNDLTDKELNEIFGQISVEYTPQYALHLLDKETDIKQVYEALKSRKPTLPRDITEEEYKQLREILNEFSDRAIPINAKAQYELEKNSKEEEPEEGSTVLVQPTGVANDLQAGSGLGDVRVKVVQSKILESQYPVTNIEPISFITKYGLCSSVVENTKGYHTERFAKDLHNFNGYIISGAEKFSDTQGKIYSAFIVPMRLYSDRHIWEPKDAIEAFIQKEKTTGEDGETIERLRKDEPAFGNKRYYPDSIEYKQSIPSILKNYNLNGKSLVSFRLEPGKNADSMFNEKTTIVENFGTTKIYNIYKDNSSIVDYAKKIKERLCAKNLYSEVKVVDTSGKLSIIELDKYHFFIEGLGVNLKESGEDLIISHDDSAGGSVSLESAMSAIIKKAQSDKEYNLIFDGKNLVVSKNKDKIVLTNDKINEVGLKELTLANQEPNWDYDIFDANDSLSEVYKPVSSEYPGVIISKDDLSKKDFFADHLADGRKIIIDENDYYCYKCNKNTNEIKNTQDVDMGNFIYSDKETSMLVVTLETKKTSLEISNKPGFDDKLSLTASQDKWGNRKYQDIPPYVKVVSADIDLTKEDQYQLSEDLSERVRETILEYSQNVNKIALEATSDYNKEASQAQYLPGISFATLYDGMMFTSKSDHSLPNFSPMKSKELMESLRSYVNKNPNDTDAVEALELFQKVLDSSRKAADENLNKDIGKSYGVDGRTYIAELRNDQLVFIDPVSRKEKSPNEAVPEPGNSCKFYVNDEIVYGDEEFKPGIYYEYKFNNKKDRNDTNEPNTYSMRATNKPVEETFGRRVSFDEATLKFETYDKSIGTWNLMLNNIDGNSFMVSEDMGYEGEDYKSGDIVVVDYTGYTVKLHRLDEKLVSEKSDYYRQLSNAYAEGTKANQSQIMDVMFYCRELGLFGDKTVPNDYDEDISVTSHYNFDASMTKRKDAGAEIVFGLRNGVIAKPGDDRPTAEANFVINTLNNCFFNVAAVIATKDEQSLSENKKLLGDFQKVFRTVLKKAQDYGADKDDYDENKKEITNAKIAKLVSDEARVSAEGLGYSFEGFIKKLKQYSALFNTNNPFGRKTFFSKVLDIDIDDKSEDFGLLTSVLNRVLDAFKFEPTSCVDDYIKFAAHEFETSNETVDYGAIVWPYIFNTDEKAVDTWNNPEKWLQRGLNVLKSGSGKDKNGDDTYNPFKKLLSDESGYDLDDCLNYLKIESNEYTRKAVETLRYYYQACQEKKKAERQHKKDQMVWSKDPVENERLRKLHFEPETLLPDSQKIAYDGGTAFQDQVYNLIDVYQYNDPNDPSVQESKKSFLDVARIGLCDFLCTTGSEDKWYNVDPWFVMDRMLFNPDKPYLGDDGKFDNNPTRSFFSYFGINTDSPKELGAAFVLASESLDPEKMDMGIRSKYENFLTKHPIMSTHSKDGAEALKEIHDAFKAKKDTYLKTK